MNIKNYIGVAFFCLLSLACTSDQKRTDSLAKSSVHVERSAVEIREPRKDSLRKHYEITKEWVLGKFEPATHNDFVEIQPRYADREGLYLHKETYRAFIEMWHAAQADSLNLQIRSATRNHEYQRGIWERKWTGKTLLEGKTDAAKEIVDPIQRSKAILRYSSMPGSSRHHWGTDIDLNAFENEYFEPGGKGEHVYNWLTKHAQTYGFCQVYSDKEQEQRTGYEMEKWHWSYMPLARQLDRYVLNSITDEDISGFMGSEHSHDVGIVNNYMKGISKTCNHMH